MRIIAGSRRGRSIAFVDRAGLRPTGDRLRETLFSWLQPYVVDSRVVDLFAGSGALGFEAASRGAGEVTLIEKSPKVCAGLRQSVDELKFDNVQIICADALTVIDRSLFSAQPVASAATDIIFIDPPFDTRMHQAVADALEHSGLQAGTLVAIENDKRGDVLQVPANWTLEKDKLAGEVRLQLYRVESPRNRTSAASSASDCP